MGPERTGTPGDAAAAGRPADARRIEVAVDADIAERGATKRPTSVVGDEIAARI